jgi:hypothetical protein
MKHERIQPAPLAYGVDAWTRDVTRHPTPVEIYAGLAEAGISFPHDKWIEAMRHAESMREARLAEVGEVW